jgi:hypothetical protein
MNFIVELVVIVDGISISHNSGYSSEWIYFVNKKGIETMV